MKLVPRAPFPPPSNVVVNVLAPLPLQVPAVSGSARMPFLSGSVFVGEEGVVPFVDRHELEVVAQPEVDGEPAVELMKKVLRATATISTSALPRRAPGPRGTGQERVVSGPRSSAGR